jgi:predicted CopG family antitoxin
MGTKQVRLDEDVYARIKDQKREGESFSEAIDRLTSDWSLAQWAEKYDTDPDRTNEHREMLDELEDVDKREAEEIVDRVE